MVELSLRISGFDLINNNCNFKLSIPRLELKQNQLLLVCGTYGSGKSYLLDSLTGLREEELGSLELNQCVVGDNYSAYRRRMGFILQNPYSQIMEFSVKEYLKNQNMDFLSNDTVEKYNLEKILNRTISSLSGGEIQKLILVIIICNQQKNIFILDSPFEMLDFQAQTLILEKIKERKKECIFIIASKNPTFISCADQLLLLSHNSAKFLSNPVEIFNKPELFNDSGMNLTEEIARDYPSLLQR